MHKSASQPWSRRALSVALAALIAAAAVIVTPVTRIVPPATAAAAGSFADPHFADFTVFSGLTQPTSVRFAADNRAYVSEKRGMIKAFDSVNDGSATTVLDLRTDVHDFWDRGLLSFALDPDFLDGDPYLYVYYVHSANAAPTGPAPTSWGDSCPNPPGSTTDGCTVSSRLDRFTVDTSTNVADPGSRLNLLSDWCQQFPSHAGGAMAFGPDGQLYVTGGDGASFGGMDYGQRGGTLPNPAAPITPVNPCNDPLTVTSPPGSLPVVTAATAEGGMLRSQDIRTTADPTDLDGTVIRINPNNGNASSGNPLAGESEENAQRIVAHGFRNPFRMTFRPGASDLYIGDVGNQTWEEIDRLVVPSSPRTPTTLPNFGWPCYEGAIQQTAFANLGTNMCTNLYAQGGAVTAPLYTYTHAGALTPKGPCFPGSADQTSSISGLAFYEGASGNAVDYPSKYDGALFFVDYSRDCLGAILPLGSGVPDPSKVEQIASGIDNPVDLVTGPGGDLFYVDHNGGRVVRVRYLNSPVAVATATPANSIAPVTVRLDGSGSIEPDNAFAIDDWDWDLDDDGNYDVSGETYDWDIQTPGIYPVKLRVHSTTGLTDTVTIQVDADNASPEVTIDTPSSCAAPGCWSVGDTINFTGHATDDEDGNLTGADLQWQIVIAHCGTSDCHEHTTDTDQGGSGSFSAPDHDYPSHLVIRLTATDSDGASTTAEVTLEPETATVSMASNPTGVPLTVGNDSNAAPWAATVIRKGSTSISGPLTRTIGGARYRFSTWNGSQQRVRDVTVNGNVTYTATYVPDAPDSCASATSNSPKRTEIRERTSGNSDSDWFRFHVSHKRSVRVTLSDLPVNGRLELFKSCSNLLEASNKPGKTSEVLTRTLKAGTYRIRVTSPNDKWSASQYSLLISPRPR